MQLLLKWCILHTIYFFSLITPQAIQSKDWMDWVLQKWTRQCLLSLGEVPTTDPRYIDCWTEWLQTWAMWIYSCKGSNTEEPNFSPQWSHTLLEVTCNRKWRTAAMICWLLLYGATDQNLQNSQWAACFYLNVQGIKTSGKSKRELWILCKHQDNCEREMKVLGRRSKGILLVLRKQGWIDPNNVDK